MLTPYTYDQVTPVLFFAGIVTIFVYIILGAMWAIDLSKTKLTQIKLPQIKLPQIELPQTKLPTQFKFRRRDHVKKTIIIIRKQRKHDLCKKRV